MTFASAPSIGPPMTWIIVATSAFRAEWLRESATWLQTQLPEHDCRGAEPRESGLQKVQAYEGAEQQPVRTEQPCQYEADQQDRAGEGEYCAIDIHDVPLIRRPQPVGAAMQLDFIYELS